MDTSREAFLDSREVITINKNSLSRAVRSLYFRRQLANAIPEIEDVIRAELISRQITAVAVDGFRVRLSGLSLSVAPAAMVHPGQLRLPEMPAGFSPSDTAQEEHPRR